MPLIQPASVLVNDHTGIRVGMRAATPKAPIWAQPWAVHMVTTARFRRMRLSRRASRRPSAACSSMVGRGVEQALHDDAVTPLPVQLPVALVDTDDPEATPLVQRQARRVLREDPGHDLPEPTLGVRLTESLESGASCTGPARRPRDIHRVL